MIRCRPSLVPPGRLLVNQGISYHEIPHDCQSSQHRRHCGRNYRQDPDGPRTAFLRLQQRPQNTDCRWGEIFSAVKRVKPDIICFVDNCYGEFIEDKEPTQVGADLMAGSLIKNLGGGIAPTGGYIVGRKDLVELASYRLTAPGLGGEMGATLGDTAREFYEGLFFAPHVVRQAIKTSIFAASVFQNLGFEVSPLPEERRSDIIQTITLKTKENLCRFCEAIQASSPVDAHVTPVPSHLPGYQDEVMAAGTFVKGASIELSADALLRTPVYLQGAWTFLNTVTLPLWKQQEKSWINNRAAAIDS